MQRGAPVWLARRVVGSHTVNGWAHMNHMASGKLWGVLAALALTACGSAPVVNHAPVVDRGTVTAPVQTAPEVAPVVRQPPGFENAGKPGYYTVKPGDTLTRIGLDHGQATADLVRWNQLDNPNRIEVGQVLRVVPPEGDVQVAAVPTRSVVAAPVAASAAGAPASQSAGVASAPAAPASKPVGAAAADAALEWAWPANGTLLGGFDEGKNKGLDIAGKAGDPVLAAADGRVVYVGSSLRGYGNLIILKHNNVYLSAYAHNKTLLVKEDQSVTRGQKIAEMGNSDADRVKLHFEVRKQGKPVDPVKYLPVR